MKFQPERSLYFGGDIDPQTAMSLMIEITKLYSVDPKSVINLHLTSSGGSVSDAFAMYDYVMSIVKPRLQTVALGEVNSMAAMLFLMGEPRYIGKLAVMKLHKFSFTPNSSIDSDKSDWITLDLNRAEKNYINIMVSRTGGKISKKTARALLNSNTVITPTQAIKLGLAHKIL